MIYLASPLFSLQEKNFNLALATELERRCTVFLPQRDGLLLSDLLREGISHQDGAERVFLSDITAIRQCCLMICVLDGRVVDEGVAFELGFAHAIGKKSFALQSDVRRLLPQGNNPMLHCAIDSYYENLVDLCFAVDVLIGRDPT